MIVLKWRMINLQRKARIRWRYIAIKQHWTKLDYSGLYESWAVWRKSSQLNEVDAKLKAEFFNKSIFRINFNIKKK